MLDRIFSFVGRQMMAGTPVVRPYFGEDAWSVDERRTERVTHSRTMFG